MPAFRRLSPPHFTLNDQLAIDLKTEIHSSIYVVAMSRQYQQICWEERHETISTKQQEAENALSTSKVH
jgi:hypothetical protein